MTNWAQTRLHTLLGSKSQFTIADLTLRVQKLQHLSICSRLHLCLDQLAYSF